MDEALLIARLILAAVFIVAGVAKLADLAGSRAAVAGFGVPERLAAPIGTLLPFAELATAVLLLPAATARGGATAALVLLLAFSAGIAASIARGEAPDCHCFGQLHSEPAGPKTLARNFGLALVAGFVLIAGEDAGPGLFEALGDLSGTAALAILLGVAVVGLLAGGALAYLQLLGQHGRVLLRVDALEKALRSRGIPIPELAEAPAKGVPVGQPAPAFELPDLEGEFVSLASLVAAGRPSVLFFTDPGCGPCNAMMPRVGAWQREHAERLTMAVLSRGGADANRAKAQEHGLASILIQENREVAEPYDAVATPSAVAIDANGRIASPVASGEPAIAALIARFGTPAVEVVQAGPVAAEGEPVPEPSSVLPDLDEGASTLADALGGEERLLLFWDPACGFCSRMLGDLVAWEREDGAGLLVVSKGDPAANRAQGISAPILLDDGFGVARSVGVRGTPSAIRVDREGRVASGVAVGADAVLALARRDGPASGESAAG
ncbi:MAG: MauE/DoxX family redox-associated membrane protein [Solirubrobacterales bacterium]